MRGWKTHCPFPNRRLDVEFHRLYVRLDASERHRVAQELAQPARRQWWIVDEQGVRRLEDS